LRRASAANRCWPNLNRELCVPSRAWKEDGLCLKLVKRRTGPGLYRIDYLRLSTLLHLQVFILVLKLLIAGISRKSISLSLYLQHLGQVRKKIKAHAKTQSRRVFAKDNSKNVNWGRCLRIWLTEIELPLK